MTEYRKTPKTNKKGRKLYGPTHDKQTKYHDSGLWIKNRKRTYLYWYKFLQICLQFHDVDKNKYRGWDLGMIPDTKFDDWWKTHWKKLFGVKNRTDTPKFHTSSNRIKIESVRMSYLICVEDIKYETTSSNSEIGYKIIKREMNNRYLSGSNLFFPQDSKGKLIHPDKLDEGQRLMVGQEISRFKGRYKKIIKNVCNGTFP